MARNLRRTGLVNEPVELDPTADRIQNHNVNTNRTAGLESIRAGSCGKSRAKVLNRHPLSYHTFQSYSYSANAVLVLVLDFVATGRVRVGVRVGVTIENALLMGS
jgi:hypothetical protein